MPDLSDMTGVLVWVAGALLVLAGAAKLRRPAATVSALAEAGLPGASGAVRLLGAVEVTVGVGVLVVGGRLPAAATAVLYGAFAAFVLRQRRTAGAACGCFGDERTPVNGVHVSVTAVAGTASVAAAITAAPPLMTADRPVTVIATAVLVAVAAWLVRLALTAGADLQAAVGLHPHARLPADQRVRGVSA